MNEDKPWTTTGNRIMRLRESKGWNKQELSEFLGMKSYTSVTHWEQGKNLPRGRELIKMVKLFNVSADYLLGLSENKNYEEKL